MLKIQSKSATKINVVAVVAKQKPLPSSWNKAVGLALKKKKSLERHAQNVRNEWK